MIVQITRWEGERGRREEGEERESDGIFYRAMDKARGILKACESNLHQAVSSLPNIEETSEPMEVTDVKQVSNGWLLMIS